jgi:hypothetical protein
MNPSKVDAVLADKRDGVSGQLHRLEALARRFESALEGIAFSYPETDEGADLASIAKDALR